METLFRKVSNEHGTVRASRSRLPNGEHHYRLRVFVNHDPKGQFQRVEFHTLSRVEAIDKVDLLLEDVNRIARGEHVIHACFGQGVSS